MAIGDHMPTRICDRSLSVSFSFSQETVNVLVWCFLTHSPFGGGVEGSVRGVPRREKTGEQPCSISPVTSPRGSLCELDVGRSESPREHVVFPQRFSGNDTASPLETKAAHPTVGHIPATKVTWMLEGETGSSEAPNRTLRAGSKWARRNLP